MWRDRARCGRAGQEFEFGETGRGGRDHRRFLATDRRGPLQDDQAVKTKLLQGAAGGFWIRAWGQREPALQGTGRLNHSAQGLGWLKGGLDIPAAHAECGSLQREHPLRTLTRCAWSGAERVGHTQFASHCSLLCEDALPVVRQPIEQSPGHSAVPFGDGRPFSRSPNSVISTKGRAFGRLTTTSKRPPGRAG
jgi:hypothetical protein